MADDGNELSSEGRDLVVLGLEVDGVVVIDAARGSRKEKWRSSKAGRGRGQERHDATLKSPKSKLNFPFGLGLQATSWTTPRPLGARYK